MKIAICCDRADYIGGGPSRVCNELAKAFLRMDHKVVFVFRYGPKSKIPKVQSYRIPKSFYLPYSLIFSLKLPKILDRLNPNLVITQLSSAPLLGKLKQRHLHIIYNLELLEMKKADFNTGFFTERPVILLCEILNCLRADRVLTINKILQKQIYRFYKRRSGVITLGVDTKKFKPAKKRKVNRVPRILCVTRWDKRRKNLSLLIQACKDLGVEFRLTSAPFKKLPSNVVALGFISDKDLVKELQNADAFILPSKQESFGLATLEALACNTPVIITKTGIWQEVAKFGAGEVVEASVEGIRRGIKKVLKTDYGNRPRKLAEMYSWNKTAKSILRIAESIKKS